MLITSLEGNITVPINSTEKISVPTSTPSLTPLFAMNLNVRPADIQLESNQTNTTPTQNNPKPSKRRRPRSMGTCSPKNFTLTGKL
jgi:hypothetical protein